MIDQSAIRRQIAAGLRRARRRAGYRLDDLAERLSMSRSGLQHLEMGRHSLRVEQLPVFAVAIGCTVRELLIDMRLVRRQPRPQERRNPVPERDGALAEGSAVGERSTLCDPRGDAGHHQHSAQPTPSGSPTPAPAEDPGQSRTSDRCFATHTRDAP